MIGGYGLFVAVVGVSHIQRIGCQPERTINTSTTLLNFAPVVQLVTSKPSDVGT